MPETIQRSTFFEEQVLGAGDLESVVAYDRNQQARHDRCLHSWGIAYGLEITLKDSATLALAAGMAIDSSGSHIIVPSDIPINASDFTSQLSPAEAEGDYPIFLLAKQEESASEQLVGRCGTGGPSRINESYRTEFRRPAQADQWDNQNVPLIVEGPDDQQQYVRPVLLAFVGWKAGKFTGVKRSNVNGVSPRYVGVVADEVVTHAGNGLTLRTKPAGNADAPMLQIDPTSKDQLLAFGADGGRGTLKDPLLSLDPKGNLTIAGTLKAAVQPGQTLIQSGQATDGVCIPLPSGLTTDQLKLGAVAVHILLTPRPDLSARPASASANSIPVVSACTVDPSRRVKCLFYWIDPAVPTALVKGTGICDYLALVVAPHV